ncbi:MAG: hypothetical protein VB032_04860 [Burkholderiaceae bacterium]|nr:hypothetical protein [Burkholderiaceae bacterium]
MIRDYNGRLHSIATVFGHSPGQAANAAIAGKKVMGRLYMLGPLINSALIGELLHLERDLELAIGWRRQRIDRA